MVEQELMIQNYITELLGVNQIILILQEIIMQMLELKQRVLLLGETILLIVINTQNYGMDSLGQK